MDSPSIAVITDTVRRLIPSARVMARRTPTRPKLIGEQRALAGVVGVVRGRPDLVLWLDLEGVGKWTVEVARPSTPFTRREWDVLGRLPDAIASYLFLPLGGRPRVAHQIASRMSLEHLIVAQVMRRGRAMGFSEPMVALETLIDLSFKRYEGDAATSGVAYTSKPELFLPAISQTKRFAYSPFSSPVKFSQEFFRYPASYRYVDGRNAFYLLNQRYEAIGVLRVTDPQRYTIVDRCAQQQAKDLIAALPGRTWCLHVGLNHDVHVLLSNGTHLQWQQNHWRVRDISLIASYIERHGCAPELTRLLVRLLVTLSELRMGTALLIPADDSKLPPTAGKIDGSRVAHELRAHFQTNSLMGLADSHTAIGLLSSDGLTTISRSGKVLSCGDILDLSSDPHSGVSGGGRTQAARVASRFGLAIKVSEDGPISLFLDGENVVAL